MKKNSINFNVQAFVFVRIKFRMYDPETENVLVVVVSLHEYIVISIISSSVNGFAFALASKLWKRSTIWEKN